MSEHMTAQRKKICLLLILIAGLTSIAAAKPLRKTLQVSPLEKRVQDLSFSSLTVVFYANIVNESSKPAYLVRYDYRFEVNDREYLNLQTDVEGGMKIDPEKNTAISLPVKITYENLFRALEGIEGEDKANCYLSGGLTFSDGRKQVERFPIAFSADFPLLKEPEVEFLSFKIRDLTIGGADLELKVLFTNRNGFELLVDKLTYIIKLGEVPINEGVVTGNKNVEGRGKKVFTFPMLFNFFEVGKEVYSTLRQPSALCHFSGEVEVMTAWGRWKIPLEKTEKVSFSRGS